MDQSVSGSSGKPSRMDPDCDLFAARIIDHARKVQHVVER